MKPAALPKPAFRSKLEASYADLLFGRKRAGEIDDYKHEAITFRLGHDLRYTPDFMIDPLAHSDRMIEFHEVKGRFFREDARVKLYACAAAFPMFRFLLVTRDATLGWRLTEVRT